MPESFIADIFDRAIDENGVLGDILIESAPSNKSLKTTEPTNPLTDLAGAIRELARRPERQESQPVINVLPGAAPQVTVQNNTAPPQITVEGDTINLVNETRSPSRVVKLVKEGDGWTGSSEPTDQ